MGQYYKAVLIDHHLKKKVFTSYDYESFAKLTEHGWIHNFMCDAVCYDLLDEPKSVAWVGDYAEADDETDKNNSYYDVNSRKIFIDAAWNEDEKKHRKVKKALLDYDGLYIINHTKEEIIVMDDYIENNKTEEGWCLHPLAILTAMGNGKGGGDYHGINMDLVGSWSTDLISTTYNTQKIKDLISKNYKCLSDRMFVEGR